MSNSREAAKGAKKSEKADSREAAKGAKKNDADERLRVFAPSRETDVVDGTAQTDARQAAMGAKKSEKADSREAAKGAKKSNAIAEQERIAPKADSREAAKGAKKSDADEKLRVFAPSRETDVVDGTAQTGAREAAKGAKKSDADEKLRVFAPSRETDRTRSAKQGISREIKTDGVHEPRDVEQLSAIVVDCAYKLHVEVGPGLLESVYEAVLARMIEQRGAAVRRQVALPFQLLGMKFNEGFRLDLLVDERLVVELKSVEQTLPVHAKQLLTYLRLADLPLGLLINFGAPTFKEGIKRVVNRHQDFASSRLRVNQGSMTEDSP